MLVKERIARERTLRGMNLSQFGELIGVDKTTVSRYEHGTVKMISIDVLRKLAEICGCEFDEFVAEDPRYCQLASNYNGSGREALSLEDEQLLNWYHNLPPRLQNVIKELWEIPVTLK